MDGGPNSISELSSFSDSSSAAGCSNSSSCSESCHVVSLLERLHAPTVSELRRKRKIHANPPPVGKKRSTQVVRKFDPQSVRPLQRVNKFLGEQLVESAGKLFCRSFRENVAVKQSVVQNYIKSKKHEENKERLKKKESRERDIAEALQAHDAERVRHCLRKHNVYRAKVVIAFMKSGISLSKLECPDLRNLLEENGYRLTDPRHMLDLVTFVLNQERTHIQSELQGKYLPVVFDGTTRLGEVLAVVVRLINDWKVEQRLVCLEFLQKSVNGEELARELISIQSVTLGIESSRLLGVVHDRASVNVAAMHIVRVVYLNALDIGCISHTLDLVGDKFKASTLHLFFTLWISLFSHSPKVKTLWKEKTG